MARGTIGKKVDRGSAFIGAGTAFTRRALNIEGGHIEGGHIEGAHGAQNAKPL
jgi:hypothetical protein